MLYGVEIRGHQAELILPLRVDALEGARKPMPTPEDVEGYITKYKNDEPADVPDGPVTWKVENIAFNSEQKLVSVQERTKGHIKVNNGTCFTSYILTYDHDFGNLGITLPATPENIDQLTK